jgi:hypothetical protein
MSASLLLVLAAVAFVAPGCASLSSLRKQPEIKGDPERTGLLIVDCRILTNFNDRGLGATLAGVDDEADVVGGTITGSSSVELSTVAQRGLLLFAGLEPGAYVIRLIRGVRQLSEDSSHKLYDCPGVWWPSCPSRIDLEYLVHTDDHSRLTFGVEAGKFVYAGQLVFDEGHEPPFETNGTGKVVDSPRHHNPREALSIQESTEHEREALEKLLWNRLPNAWTVRVQERLVQLASASTAPAPPPEAADAGS